jgi:hypothetical protein
MRRAHLKKHIPARAISLRLFVLAVSLILFGAAAARADSPLQLPINLVIENRTILIYAPDGGGLKKGLEYEISANGKLVAKAKIIETAPNYAKGTITKLNGGIVEGNEYKFVPVASPKPKPPAGSSKLEKSVSTVPESGESVKSEEKTSDRRRAQKKDTGSGEAEKSAAPASTEKKSEPPALVAKKTAAPPWHETPDTDMADEDGVSGLVMLPAARTIGHYGLRASLAWSSDSFDTEPDFSGGSQDVDDHAVSFDVGYGLTDNIEFAFAYQKDHIARSNYSVNESSTFITHHTSLKYTFPGDWPGRAKIALVATYENTNVSGDQTDSLTSAAAVDHKVKFVRGGVVTGMYGVKSTGDRNISVWGAGVEAPASKRTKISLEYSGEMSTSNSYHNLSQWAFGAQYRLQRDWSYNMSFVRSEGGYWDSNDGFKFRIGAVYHPKWRD